MNRLLLVFAVLLTLTGKAQQRPLYSQYMTNQFFINPAFTGKQEYFIASSNFRYQWVGLVDPPRTYAVSVHGPLGYFDLGIGGSIYNDVTGPTSKSGVNLSTAKHLQITSNTKLAVGLRGGLMQFRIDGTKLTVFQPGDQVLQNQRMTTIIPDFGVGIYWYQQDKFYLGMSAPQLLYQTPISFTDNNVNSPSKLNTHYFMNGGYTFRFGDWGVEPSAMLKYVAPVEVQLDAGLRLMFKDIVWIGGVFRTQDAYSGLIGLTTPDKRFSFGYSYDFTTSGLQNYSYGTHEIMISARFGKRKGYKSRGKAKKSDLERLQEKMEEYQMEELETEEAEKKKKAEREKAKKRIKELEKEDQALRDRIRRLREEAKLLGFDSPKNEGYGKRDEYLRILNEVKRIYAEKKALEQKL